MPPRSVRAAGRNRSGADGARPRRALESGPCVARGPPAARCRTRGRAGPPRGGGEAARRRLAPGSVDPAAGPGAVDRGEIRRRSARPDRRHVGCWPNSPRRSPLDGDRDVALRMLWSAAQRCFWTEPGRPTPGSGSSTSPRTWCGGSRTTRPGPAGDPRVRGADRSWRRGHRQPAPDRGAAGPMPRRSGCGQRRDPGGRVRPGRRLSARLPRPGLRAQGRLGLLARALGAQAWSAAHLGDLTSASPPPRSARRLARETSQPLFIGIGQATAAVWRRCAATRRRVHPGGRGRAGRRSRSGPAGAGHRPAGPRAGGARRGPLRRGV